MSELNDKAAEFDGPAPGSDEVEVDLTPGGKVPKCDDGKYRVVLKEIGKMKSTFGEGMATVLKFAIKGREDDGTINVTPAKTSKGAFPWATVLSALKIAFKEGDRNTFKQADLLGKECDAFIVNEPGKKDASKKFPRIKALVAA